MTALENLGLHFKSISNISLVGLTALKALHMDHNKLSDTSFSFTGLTALETLYIHGNNISDVSPFAASTTLKHLKIENNNISDISPLAALTVLETLFAAGNNISDISPLAALTNLKRLYLETNNISDISPLTALTALKHFFIRYNNISDISPLVELMNLEVIGLEDNPLNYPSYYTHIPALQERGVLVWFNNLDHRVVLSKVSGDGQMDAPGIHLTPFVIEAKYNESFGGKPFTKAPIKFIVATGDGTLSVEEVITDENGRAQTTLTLGNTDTTVAVVDWKGRGRAKFEAKVGKGLPDVVEEVPDVTLPVALEVPHLAKEDVDATPSTGQKFLPLPRFATHSRKNYLSTTKKQLHL